MTEKQLEEIVERVLSRQLDTALELKMSSYFKKNSGWLWKSITTVAAALVLVGSAGTTYKGKIEATAAELSSFKESVGAKLDSVESKLDKTNTKIDMLSTNIIFVLTKMGLRPLSGF